MKTSLSITLLTGAGLGLAVGLLCALLLMVTTGGGSPLYLIILLASALTGFLSVLLVPARSVHRIDKERLKEAVDRLFKIAEESSTKIKSLGADSVETLGAWGVQTELLSEDLNRLSIQLATISAQLASQAGDLPSLAAQVHRLADRGLELKARSKSFIDQSKGGGESIVQLLEQIGVEANEVGNLVLGVKQGVDKPGSL